MDTEIMENEVMDIEAVDVVEEIEAENSGKGLWVIGAAAVAIGAGYALVKKVIVPGVKKLKAKHEEKKAAKNAHQFCVVEDTEFEKDENA